MANETIVALATAPGESAIAVVRLSGPEAISLASRRFRGRTSPAGSPSHRVLFGSLLGSDDSPLDTVLLSVFRAPRSYTGEDVVEISCHGGFAIPRAILEELVRIGARPARPGEFTERAFRNGKLDLAQAESIASLVRARSERAVRAARSALGGSLSRRLAVVDADLVLLLAEVEARIDFPGDVGDSLDGAALGALGTRCGSIAASIRDWISHIPGSRRLQEGVRAALVGRPNVGKSSLLNALVGYERSIVDPFPGTTRDTVEESLWIDGLELRVVDTAGVREGAGSVERLGVERSARAASECDLAVLVLDRSDEIGADDLEVASLVRDRPVVVAWNKADLGCRGGEGGVRPRPRAPVEVEALLAEVETVAIRPGGAEPLVDALRSAMPRVLGDHAGEDLAATSVRQEGLLVEALAAVERAEAGLRGAAEPSYDLIAVDLGDARRALGEIVGRAVDDEVVAAIFARFCIGK